MPMCGFMIKAMPKIFGNENSKPFDFGRVGMVYER
jgi:hypothetical protein